MATLPTKPVVATQPRLSIIHLLGWTLGCAIVLGVSYWAAIVQGDQAEVAWQTPLAQFGFSLAYGAALGGLGLLLWRRFYGGYPFPTQPGHWLLVLGGIGCLIDAGHSASLMLYLRWAEQQQIDANLFVTYVQRASGWGIAGAIGLAILWRLSRLRDNRRWWILTILVLSVLLANAFCWGWLAVNYQLYVNTARGVAISEFMVPWTSEFIGSVICLIALAAVVWFDGRSDAQRDWLHSAGVGTALCLAALHVAMSTWSLLWWL